MLAELHPVDHSDKLLRLQIVELAGRFDRIKTTVFLAVGRIELLNVPVEALQERSIVLGQHFGIVICTIGFQESTKGGLVVQLDHENRSSRVDVILGYLDEVLEEVLDMEQVCLMQIARQIPTIHATIVGKFPLQSGGVAREGLEIIEDEFRQTTILQLTTYNRSGSQNHLEPELPSQFEKYNQVLGRISNSRKIEVFSFVLVDIPRHCRRDNAKPGPLDSFETDGPVPLVDSEVMHLNRERLICLLADRELVTDYA